MREKIGRDEIAKRVKELGKEISRDYKDKKLVVLCVLKGGFVFCSDLIREITVPMHIEFITLSSYGDATQSSGNVKVLYESCTDFQGKDVLIVEDIVDTGLSMKFLLEKLEGNCKDVRVVSFLVKPTVLKNLVTVDYRAFDIAREFVIGYGLDYAQDYRQLPYLGVKEE